MLPCVRNLRYTVQYRICLGFVASPHSLFTLAYDDGRTQLLLCIYGLLPISYQQASYNIPIAVWLTKEYPRQPPIAYVVPTNDMLVKAGKYVDVSGRCQIEYIQHWQKKSEVRMCPPCLLNLTDRLSRSKGCNLLALLEAMQDQFSREPPVFAKPKNSGSVRQTASPIQTTKSPGDKPMLPPKPGSSVNQIISQAPPNVQASSPSASVHSLSRAQSVSLNQFYLSQICYRYSQLACTRKPTSAPSSPTI